MAWGVGIGLFVALLFAFPRATGGVLLFVAVTLGAIFLWNQQQTKKRAQQRAAVTVSAAYDLRSCQVEHPIRVTINNGSDRSVLKVTFKVAGYLP